MKRLITSFVTTITMLFSLTGVAAAATWMASISQLPSTMNTHSFNVQYTVLSTQADSFTATLLESTNGGAYVQCGPSQDTNSDPNDVNGGAGALPACVSADGNYSFKVLITRDESEDPSQTVGPTNTHVDATAPAAPTYNGKTQSGNTYTISFTAPSTADVTNVKVFSSTSKTYTADSAHQVGNVAVEPGQTVNNFTYTAPDSSTRYFSVQAFDAAGNGSSLVGDPGTVVNPVVFVNQGGAVATAQTAAATTPATAGQVQGVSTTTPNTGSTGQVNASGKSTSSSSNKGKVLGIATTNKSSKKGWYYGAGATILVLLAAYWFFNRNRKSLSSKP
jgi:hypothetical protein